MRMLYIGGFMSASGYSRAARMHGRALFEAGVRFQISNRSRDPNVVALDAFWKEKLPALTLAAGDPLDHDVVLWHCTPEFYEPTPGPKNVALVAWETDRIPAIDIGGRPQNNWVRQLNRMDQVWVPCDQNRRALRASGVTRPIEVVPHPIRMADYPLASTVKPLIPRDPAQLTLLSVFQWQPRKDPLSLLLGFYGASVRYGKDLPARLLLKTYRSDFKEGTTEIVKKIREVKASFHTPPANVVMPLFDPLSDADMPRLYASADAYISTTRGEGFCLPMVEAMAMGIPVIGPRVTAMEDFLDENTGYPVKHSLTPVFGMGWIPWYGAEQRWAQVDVEDLEDKIFDVEEDRTMRFKDGFSARHGESFLARRGLASREFVRKAFDSAQVGQQMKELLERLVKEKVYA